MPRGFLYFIPTEKKALVAEDLRAVGLGYATDRPGDVSGRRNERGPDGLAGVVVSIEPPGGGESPPALFLPEQQTWRKGPGGKYFVGFHAAERPGPDELRRERLIDGERVKLRDGNEWIVPRCLSMVRRSTLPSSLVLGEDNQTWETQTLPEFLKLCGDAEAVYQAWRAGIEDETSTVRMDRQDACRIAADALAVNYRIGPLEISLLGLWSTEEMWSILHAMIDGPEMHRVVVERQKKDSAPGT